MMRVSVYYYDNGVGISSSARLISNELSKNFNCDINYIHSETKLKSDELYDIGLFIQYSTHELLERNKVNILYAMEEWISLNDLYNLHKYDIIIANSKYAKKQLDMYHPNVVVLYGWSEDRYINLIDFHTIIDYNISYVHFAGKSIQKNTEQLLDIKYIDKFDATNRFKCINTFLNDFRFKVAQNSYDTHICPSLYEAFGHYMFEAMTCNKQVIATRIPIWDELVDPDYITFIDPIDERLVDKSYEFLTPSYDKMTTWPFRRGFITTKDQIEEAIQQPDHKPPREYILDLFEKNKSDFIKYFKSTF